MVTVATVTTTVVIGQGVNCRGDVGGGATMVTHSSGATIVP